MAGVTCRSSSCRSRWWGRRLRRRQLWCRPIGWPCRSHRRPGPRPW
uniref:Uncharacterized protein n=1 Tax=Arundo donax TaxID=35708 RepID=A0A0A9F7L3_ARUDO